MLIIKNLKRTVKTIAKSIGYASVNASYQSKTVEISLGTHSVTMDANELRFLVQTLASVSKRMDSYL